MTEIKSQKTMLRERILRTIHNEVDAKSRGKIGIAFSGGVDSSVLAKVCKDLGKDVILLTIGFSGSNQSKVSKEVADFLGMKMVVDVIELDELEEGMEFVLKNIDFGRIARFQNCVCFYYLFKLAERNGVRTVISANGIDELFCGYDMFRREYGNEESMNKLINKSLETAKTDTIEILKLANKLKIRYSVPFMSKEFIDFALKIPVNLKIKNKEDEMKKHIWREVAMDIGLLKEIAFRPKKAFQYSSGLSKSIVALARRKGFTNEKAKAAGFGSGVEMYITKLRKDLGVFDE